jgi:HSP20 family protein
LIWRKGRGAIVPPALETAPPNPSLNTCGAADPPGADVQPLSNGGSLMVRSLFARDVFADLDRLQREMSTLFDYSPAIRGGRGSWPALNVGSSDNSVEIYAFAPGLEPSSIDVNLDRGVLTIAGEVKSQLQGSNGGNGDAQRPTLHLNERFAGRFRRVVNLPDDIDPSGVTADYRDGVLRVSVARRESAKPRRIAVN